MNKVPEKLGMIHSRKKLFVCGEKTSGIFSSENVIERTLMQLQRNVDGSRRGKDASRGRKENLIEL